MKVSLTFDNGPTSEVTPHVLSCLRRHRAPATFFPLGKNLAQPALRELALQAYADGHRLGNHSYNHGIPFGMLERAEESIEEIRSTDVLLGDLRGSEPLFRPFGRARIGPHLLNRLAWEYLRVSGYTCVLWTYVARESAQPDDWFEAAFEVCQARDWTVIVMHDIPTGAMRKLDNFLAKLATHGAQFSQDFPPESMPMRRGIPMGRVDHLMPAAGQIAADPLAPQR